jgi:hypothetical protein
MTRSAWVLGVALVLEVAAISKPASACTKDTDCSAHQWCNESSATCTAQFANGTPMPVDAPHTAPTLNGVCTSAAGTLVCAAGVCDTSDNRCGYASGDGPCTSANGGVVCRSGDCSVDGKCIPASGCGVDADCSSNQWCNESSATCMARIANGGAIPVDQAHSSPTLNGTCTANAAALVCAAGVCDTDNACGYETGDGPCTVATGPTVCRSGACSSTTGDCAKAIPTPAAGAPWATGLGVLLAGLGALLIRGRRQPQA